MSKPEKEKKVEIEKKPTVTLPPPPTFETNFQGSDIAVSKAIEKFTSEDPQSVKVLANLSSKDKGRLAIMNTIERSFQLTFLGDYAMAFCTYSAAQDGKRAEQLTEVVKQPNIIAEGSSGIIGNIRDRLVGRH